MNLSDWAKRHNVSPLALMELSEGMGIAQHVISIEGVPASESRQQALVRIEASQLGIWLTRNNVGALKDERGVPVRYGLCNDSPALNKAVKSSDLIGIRPILVGPQHVGSLIGQFVAREIKEQSWKYKGDKHEVAQKAFLDFVLSKGGDASFATGPGSFNY